MAGPPNRVARGPRTRKRRFGDGTDRRREPDFGPLYLYGIHAVQSALDNPSRVVRRLLATRNAIARLPGREGLSPEIVEPKVIDRLVGQNVVHQGVVVEVEPLEDRTLSDIVPGSTLLVLDQVTDPHNVGAILRSAAAMGVGALVTTRRHAPSETATLAKTASGGLEHVPIVRVGNLAAAIEELRSIGYTTVGLDSDGPETLETALPDGPVAIVLGAEGTGLRQRTREVVDRLARLDMPGPIRSLNVSNAAALALYAVIRRNADQDVRGRRQRISAAKES